jgi:hypothetical protein
MQETYLVCVGSAIVNGPRIDSDPQTIKDFFKGIEDYKKEYGKNSIRVFHKYYSSLNLAPIRSSNSKAWPLELIHLPFMLSKLKM